MFGWLGAISNEVDQNIHGLGRLSARELLDGRGHGAVIDRDQCLWQRVEPDDRDVEPLACATSEAPNAISSLAATIAFGSGLPARAIRRRDGLVAGERSSLADHHVDFVLRAQNFVETGMPVDRRRLAPG